VHVDWLRAEQQRGQNSRPGRVEFFLCVAQTGSGAHPASYPMGTVGLFLGRGVKRPGNETGHSATSAEVTKTWIWTSSYAFMA
jgi:hypothetical protein